MHDDDEILEVGDPRSVAQGGPRSNRGFWLVAGALLVTSMLLVVAIFANRGTKDAIAHAQFTLRTAQAAAERIRVETGGFVGADAATLGARGTDLTYVGADAVSAGPGEVSVLAGERGWAAAVSARPNACFYLRIDDDGEVSYGSGTVCTGREALAASDTRW